MEPRLEPAFLGEAHNADGRWVACTLMFGNVFGPDGRFVTVVSHTAAQWRSLEAMIDDERARLFEHAGIDDTASVDVQELSIFIAVDGQPLKFALRREGSVWAARSDVGQHAHMTVVARGIPMETGLSLDLVTDLAPFWAGRDRWLDEMREVFENREAARSETVHASGVVALRELVEQQLLFDEELRSQLTGERLSKGFGPRVSRDLHPRRGLWSDAADALVELRGLDPITANEEVTSMVNHLTSLAAEADWFDREALHTKAVDETIGFHAERADVASSAAQRAWADWWASTQHRRESRPELQLAWLDAWRDWAKTSD